MNQKHIYIYFNTKDIEYINSAEDIQKYLEHTSNLIDRVDCEKYTNIYYQGTNKEEFVKNLNVIQDCINVGNYSIEDTINILLQYAENWEIKPKYENNEKNCCYRVWDIDSKGIITDYPPVLNEIIEKYFQTKEMILWINTNRAYKFNRSFIPLIKDCKSIEDELLPSFYHIQYVVNFGELETWFRKKNTQRFLNTTDERHQEKSSKYIQGKSPLLYDLKIANNQEYIKNLLESAITDQRSEERASKDLINFDTEKGCYIWFESENFNNQYHAYHLVKPKTHERDLIAEEKIPQRVRDILSYRRINKKVPN
ncbi:MAG: hypothetical protein MUC49_13860 [Raineya sp.]|jgi:hypothetical protein|nr:hypothetical protein [Raineya sp.]